MRKQFLLGLAIPALLLSSCQTDKQEPITSVIERGLSRSTEQALLMAKELENKEGQFPKTINKDGALETDGYGWWCCGFFPGELWYLYENNPSDELKKYAELYTDRVEPAKNLTNTHDLGFMLYCSYGNGYRITQNPTYKEILLTGANSLATRFNPTIGAIKSWDFNTSVWQFPVIIDNMMNLEFFTWASRASGDPKFKEMALSHADKTIQNHFRPDNSSYHVVSYDTITGDPHIKQTHQGYADESAWARGQAWGLYGYTMMYRETGEPIYLEQARCIAKFIMNHPNLPEDKIPYWDFDDPKIPNVPRDASAAAIMASAFIELSQMDNSEFGKACLDLAEQQLRSLSSPEYLAERGENHFFVLKHSTGNLPGNSEVDVPLSYADYYYVEALMRLKKVLDVK
jgi:unsaturated chondroitin disaccharide hydrolase